MKNLEKIILARNLRVWKKIDKELTKRQGTTRSVAYQAFRLLSLNGGVPGNEYTRLLKNMTYDEKELLK